jgi:hypothetical protein
MADDPYAVYSVTTGILWLLAGPAILVGIALSFFGYAISRWLIIARVAVRFGLG